SRLARLHVPVERITFTGANLTAMATMVLDTFNSSSIGLYRHEQLILDLGRLRVEEKSYGLRLSSPRGPSGHGDLATALALALLVGKSVYSAGIATGRPFRILGNPPSVHNPYPPQLKGLPTN